VVWTLGGPQLGHRNLVSPTLIAKFCPIMVSNAVLILTVCQSLLLSWTKWMPRCQLLSKVSHNFFCIFVEPSVGHSLLPRYSTCNLCLSANLNFGYTLFQIRPRFQSVLSIPEESIGEQLILYMPNLKNTTTKTPDFVQFLLQ
jgi:hypothetical protein